MSWETVMKDMAVMVVRLEDTRRRLEGLTRTMAEQDARLVQLRSRIEAQRAAQAGHGNVAPAVPHSQVDVNPGPNEQEGDFVGGGAGLLRQSDVRELGPRFGSRGALTLGQPVGVTAGILALLGKSEEPSDR